MRTIHGGRVHVLLRPKGRHCRRTPNDFGVTWFTLRSLVIRVRKLKKSRPTSIWPFLRSSKCNSYHDSRLGEEAPSCFSFSLLTPSELMLFIKYSISILLKYANGELLRHFNPFFHSGQLCTVILLMANNKGNYIRFAANLFLLQLQGIRRIKTGPNC